MNITVYLGANEGNDPRLRKSVEELGAWIGSSGNALVYGGSKSGLMGAIADSVLQAGGEVTGIEPQFFIENELQHDGLTKLIVTKDMSERKAASSWECMKSTRKFYAQKAYTRMGILDTLCAIRAKSTRAVIRLDWASNTSPERICRFYQQSGVLNRQQ